MRRDESHQRDRQEIEGAIDKDKKLDKNKRENETYIRSQEVRGTTWNWKRINHEDVENS